MGRDLEVIYFERPVYEMKVHNVPVDHKDYKWDYDYEWVYCDNDQRARYVSYDQDWNSIPKRNPDLGCNDHFSGSKEDLHNIIENMLTNEDDYDYRNYEAIGNLSKLLAACPEDYDYIVIECD